MDRITLRTLTEKSTMKFGKYHDLTVRQILTLHGIKGLKYLRWVYYNASNISFCIEILDEIGIHEAIRIQKPSKVSEAEYHEFLKQIKHKILTEQEKGFNKKNALAEKKRRRKNAKRIDGLVSSKTYLQRKNLKK